MRMRPILAAVLLSVSACAETLPPGAFRAVNSSWVFPEPENPQRFYVPWNGGAGDADMFCAAGDYVTRRLRLGGGTAIFRQSEPPRRAGQGIWFSLDPEGAASRTGITTFVRNGPENSFSASSGVSFCDLLIIR